jgi:hypothetical protein
MATEPTPTVTVVPDDVELPTDRPPVTSDDGSEDTAIYVTITVTATDA